MYELNLKERNEERSPITIKLYTSDIEAMRTISASTGISVQNLVRHAVNNMLDELK
jgi:predicted DNA binding CopG/RHH family protein